MNVIHKKGFDKEKNIAILKRGIKTNIYSIAQ